MSKSRRIISAALLSGVLIACIGIVVFNTHKSLAAEGSLADSFTYNTVSGTTKISHSYTIKSYGKCKYDNNGDGVVDVIIDADDIRKIAAVINDAQAIADAALN